MSINRFIKSFTYMPKEIFRVNNGRPVRLRARPAPIRPQGLFDLLTVDGKVRPLALNPAKYEFPNGTSMRPNTAALHYIVGRAKRDPVFVYSVKAGVELPADLILVHEFRDHYSLQAKREMTVSELDGKTTELLNTQGECLTKEEWRRRYPRPTERY